MLKRQGNQWMLYPVKVRYSQHGEPHEQWALPNREWWKDFAERWEHTTIDGFDDITLTDEQRKRYQEIADMPEDFSDLYERYILTGDLSSDVELRPGHPFEVLRLRKENDALQKENRMLQAQNKANSDRADFHEELITELAFQVYP